MSMPRDKNRPESDDGVTIAIRALPSDPNLRQVRVGRRTVATLQTTDVESLGLEVGQRWTPALTRRVSEVVAHNACRKIAMSLLSRRGYSRAELVARLTKRGCDAHRVEAVADEMQRDGWMNERAYAEDVVQGTLRRGPAGRRLIEERLARRSIAVDVASEMTSKAVLAQDDRREALAFARQRFATMSGIEPAKAARRLAGLLARRGFDDQVIAEALETLRLAAPPGSPDK